MLLFAPNGAEVNVRNDSVERLLANGFTRPKPVRKEEEEEKTSKPRRKKAE